MKANNIFKALLLLKGITPIELAKKLRLTHQRIYQLLKEPTDASIMMIAKKIGIEHQCLKKIITMPQEEVTNKLIDLFCNQK